MPLCATLKTAGLGGFAVKISVNKDNLWNSDRRDKGEAKHAKMILLWLKAVKIWLILIIGGERWVGVVEGWCLLVFDLKAIQSFGET